MTSSADFFEEITSDRLHGSSQLYAKFLSLFKTYIRQVEEVDRKFVSCLARDVVSVRSDMAPFYYAALRISDAMGDKESDDKVRESLLMLADELEKEHSQTKLKIVDNLRESIEIPEAVLLHSNSGTVTCVLKELFDKDVRVFVSDAEPDCEGARLGEELAVAGYKVVLFPDDARALYLEQVDLVLLGTDWVAESDFTNKIGTHTLALAAVNAGKPLVVLTDGSKLVPGRFRAERKVNSVRLKKNLNRETPLFEEIDNQLVDKFVTDLGIFSPSEIGAFVETRLKYVNFTLS